MKQLNFKKLILNETEDFFFINKPQGLSSLDERQGNNESLLSLAKKIDPKLQLCHRLDKVTSGVMLIAKNNDAYKHAVECFSKRKVNKIYHAFVEGVHQFENKRIDAPLSTTKKGTAKIDIGSKGKEATTFVNTLHAFRNYTLVECKPITGRLHQIRIHMAYAHAPLISDSTYGGKPFLLSNIKRKFNLKKWTEEEPLIKRAALHACSLSLPARNSKEIISADAPYPKDLSALERQLKLHNN